MVRLLSPLEILRQKSSGLLGPSSVTTQPAPATSLLPAQSASNFGMLGPSISAPAPRAPIQSGIVSPLVALGGAPGSAQPDTRMQEAPPLLTNFVGDEFPDSALPWLQQIVDEDSGPGKPGQSFLSRLFVGEIPPGVSKEQAERLRRQALLTAGLNILASDRTGLQAVAAGILIARRGSTESIGALLDEENRQQAALRFRSALNDDAYPTELAKYTEARRRALIDGDLEAVKVLTDIVSELRSLPADSEEREFRIVGGDAFWVGRPGTPSAGKVFDLAGRPITPAMLDAKFSQPQPGRTFTKEIRGQNGLLHSVLFDGRTGQPIRDLGISEAVKTQQGGTSPVDRAMADTLDRELGILDEVFSARGFRPFNRVEEGLLNEARSTDQQRFDAAMKNVVSLIIRARSGAQASELEAQRLESFSRPRPGDSPQTVREKLERLRFMIEDLRGGGSPAIPPGGAVDFNVADAILSGGAK